MKKIVISCLAAGLMVAPTLLFAQLGGAFTLRGKIGNLNSPRKIYLATGLTPKSIIDSSIVKDGVFELKGKLKEPQMVYLVAAINPEGVSVGIGKSEGTNKRFQIPPDYKNFYLDKGETIVNSPDSLIRAKVSGGSAKLNAELKEMYEGLNAAFAEQGAVGEFEMKATDVEKETESFKKNFEAKRLAADAMMFTAIADFIKRHPGSIVGLEGMSGYMNGAPYALLKETFGLFSDDVKNTEHGRHYANMLVNIAKTAVGLPAPEFSSTDVSGKTIHLSDFRGKYVLVDFWASWCVPCRKENPNVVKAYQKFKDRNFTIVSVSLDRSKTPWLQAIEKDKLSWTNVCDFKEFSGEASINYGIKTIPTNFLIDPNGKIVAISLRDVALEEKLQEILK